MGKNKAQKRRAAKKNAKAVERQPAGPEEMSLQLKETGNRAFALADYDEALKAYSSAIELNDSDRALYSNRSATYVAKKEYTNALADAEKIIELSPEWAKGYLRKGRALEFLHKTEEARAAYQLGLEQAPNDGALLQNLAELDKMMAEMKLTEEEMKKGPENPEEDKFEVMVRWLKDGGAEFPKLYLQYYEADYRGVHCLTRIPADDTVLYVPFKYIMTSEVARASTIGKQIIASGVDLRSKHSYLASYIIQETMAESSFWDPYLKILPEKYANMPLFFDEEQLAMLKGSFSLEKIADQIDSLRREYDNIRSAVSTFATYTHEQFVWARLVVITRIFGLVIDGTKTDGLVPYADMLNHKQPRETKWTFDDDRYGFIITSLKTLNRGEQVFDSYGRKCNSRFFVNYGFSLENNADCECTLRTELPKTDPSFSLKLRFLGGRVENSRREFQIPANYRQKKCKELLSWFRFIHAVDSELMMLGNSDGFKLDQLEPISVRNETAVLEDIKKHCQQRLKDYPDSFEEDERLLASPDVPAYSNLRNIILMRHGEKKCLRWFVDLCDKAVPLLQMSWGKLKRTAAKAYQATDPFSFYVTSVVVPLVKKTGVLRKFQM
jgi:histone-lysine N-methyltransferase SETD3